MKPLTKEMTEAMSQGIYEQHCNHIGASDYNDERITAQSLRLWSENPNREYFCTYCGLTVDTSGRMVCRRCGGYKGITPKCSP